MKTLNSNPKQSKKTNLVIIFLFALSLQGFSQNTSLSITTYLNLPSVITIGLVALLALFLSYSFIKQKH
jgi:hypothetical protein